MPWGCLTLPGSLGGHKDTSCAEAGGKAAGMHLSQSWPLTWSPPESWNIHKTPWPVLVCLAVLTTLSIKDRGDSNGWH